MSQKIGHRHDFKRGDLIHNAFYGFLFALSSFFIFAIINSSL